MNLKFSLGLLGMLCSSAAVAHESGFYTGAGAILSSAQADTKVMAIVPAVGTYADTFPIRKPSWSGVLFGGYQKYFDSGFLAGEIFANPFQDSIKKTTPQDYVDRQNGNILFQGIQVKTLRKFSVGARFKYGRHFDNKTAAFISLGLIGSQFRVNHRDTITPQSVNYKAFLFGYAPGAGLKYYVKPHLPISFQYEYQIYNTLKTKDMSLVAGDSLIYKVKNRYHSFMLSVSCEI